MYLHDTYYVIAHFHYVVAPGTIFALFAGVYFWFPKITGRKMNEFWGRVHFWCSFVFMNLVFMPMFAQGIKGMLRRMSDGAVNYSAARVPGAIDALPGSIMELNAWILWAAIALGHRANSVHHQSLLQHQPRRKSDQRQSLAGHHAGLADAHAAAARQFCARAARRPRALRIQRARPCHGFHAAERAAKSRRAATQTCALKFFMEIPYTIEARPDTGVYNAKLGIWLFLASEVMLFGGLFSAYVLLRVGAEPGMWPHGWLNVTLGTVNTLLLALSAITTLLAWAACKVREFGKFKFFHACTILLALTFLGIKSYEYHDKWIHYEIALAAATPANSPTAIWWKNPPTSISPKKPARSRCTAGIVDDRKDLMDLRSPTAQSAKLEEHTIAAADIKKMENYGPKHNTFTAIYFTLTGLHALHILGGTLVIFYLWGPGSRMWTTDPERFTNRIEVSGLFWHFVDLVWIFLFPVLYLT